VNEYNTLKEGVKIKGVIPLWYVDSITQEERRVGALIADSGKKGVPVSHEDFEYLKVVGELIGAAIGKAELTEQLIESYKRKEIMVRETAHAFRNRLTAIGGFSRRIAELAKDKDLGDEARLLYQEVQLLESHLEQFEKYL
jgi:signal transduction histidine kinase